MMMTIEETREYMRRMQETGQYIFYEDIDQISDDKVVDRYMTMMNTMSDMRTHTDW